MRRLLVLLVIASLVGCAEPADEDLDLPDPTSSTTARESSDTSPPTSQNDLDVLKDIASALKGLPAGWAECCPPIVDTPADLNGHICGLEAQTSAQFTAGYQTQFSLNLTREGNEDGHLIVHAALTPSPSIGATEFAVASVPEYTQCLIDDVNAAITQYYLPAGTPPATTAATGGALPVAEDVVVSHLVTTAEIQGQTAHVYTSVVQLHVGRFLARIEVNTFDGPAPPSLLVAVVESLGARARVAA